MLFRSVINGRTRENVEGAVGKIRRKVQNANIYGIAADLSDAAGADAIISHLPDLDILVNNLGIFEAKSFEKIEDSDWQRFFDINIMSGVRLSRHYLPKMKQKDWGRIVFISSESGIHIPQEMIHYGMTKAAQIAIARGMAETTAGTGVTVNSVLPGPTSSRGVSDFVNQMAEEKGISFEEMENEFFREIRPTSLLKRFSSPQEVAHLVVYLCSPKSSATNGAPLRVDGGVVRAMV